MRLTACHGSVVPVGVMLATPYCGEVYQIAQRQRGLLAIHPKLPRYLQAFLAAFWRIDTMEPHRIAVYLNRIPVHNAGYTG
jgi:hypothetical protein